jgi:hypothetical protein
MMANDNHHQCREAILEWQARISVLRNRNLWFGFLVGLAIPCILMGVVFASIGTMEGGLMVGGGSLLLFLVIFLAIGAVVDLCGGFRAVFRLTETGVESLSGKAAQRAAQVASVAGVIAGSAGAVGAGLAAREEAHVSIPWNEVRSVVARENARYISVRGEFGSKPIGLYCTQENYQEVLRIVQERSGKTART